METKQTITQNWKQLNREERGKLIFENGNIKQTPTGWRVISQTSRAKSYMVKFNGHEPKCNCPDCTLRKNTKCKHIYAVELYLRRKINSKGNITETRGVKVTYGQKWLAYNKAQTNEKLIFMKLLKDFIFAICMIELKVFKVKKTGITAH